MPFELELDEKALQQLREMPAALRNSVIDRLLDLREDGDLWCRHSVFPFPPGYLLDEFSVPDADDGNGGAWNVTIILSKSEAGKLLIFRFHWNKA